MMRYLLGAAMLLAAAITGGSTFPPGLDLSLTRAYPAGPHELNTPVRVFACIEVGEPGPLEHLFYSEQFPHWIRVDPELVTVNAESRAFALEVGDLGEILEGYRPYRWIIDDPAEEGGTVLQEGDQVLIGYLLHADQEGLLAADHEGWFGSLPQESGTAVFGNDDAPMLIAFAADPSAPDPGARPFTLRHAFPNPFNPATHLSFASNIEQRLRLDILDIHGRLVRHLADRPFSVGHHKLPWDGQNSQGSSCPSGPYLARLANPAGITQTQKLLLLK